MTTFEPKKMTVLRILDVLKDYSDADHPLTHEAILAILEREYGLIVERKAVGRNISFLNEAGYDVVVTKKGSYLNERPFDDTELRLLIDGVLSSKHVSTVHSKDLIERLCALSNKYFKNNVKYVTRLNDWDKTENADLFWNIEIVSEAISSGKKVSFFYNKYGADKRLHHSSKNVVSPYQMILHNQRYYLMAYNEKFGQMKYLRLDRITEIAVCDEPATPLRSLTGYENGIDYKRFSAQMPYMFADEIQAVTFRAEPWSIDQVIDWFGKDITIKEDGEKFLVTVKTSLLAMEFWAMQYLNAVKILTPTSLREKIKENLENGVKKYE